MSTENEELKALKCHECGGDIVKSYRTEDEDEEIPVARCLSCGHEYDQYSQEYYEFFADDFLHDKDKSIFKLGLKGTLEDIEYEIIGRIRFQEEDDYEVSTWDEWLAISSDGVYHYFVEEEGDIRSFEEYVPESIDLESSDSHIDFEGKRISKNDAYVGRIVFAEGELPWQPEIGEPVTLYDFKKDGIKYSIEQSEGEVSITKGDRISYKEIIDAFGEDEHKELYDATMAKRKVYRNKARVYLIALALSLLFMIYGCVSGTPVKGLMNSKKIISNNEMIAEKNKRSYFSQVLYGPFEVPAENVLYDFDVSIDESIHRLHLEWQSFRLMLLKEDRLNDLTKNKSDFQVLKNLLTNIDAQKEPVESYVITGDFWDEQGYDSEGSWHESDVSASSDFVLDEAGRYYAYLELYSKKKRKIESVKLKMASSGSMRYYVILAFVFSCLMMINKSKSKSYNELPFDIATD